MATTEAIFNLRVNTGNSVQDVENLNNAVKETQTTAGSGKGMDDFTKKLDALDKKLADGNLTFRQRSRLIKEYQAIALQAGETSPVGDRAVRSAAALTDQLGDMNQRVRLLASDTVKLDTALQGISVGASAFQGVQSAIALTGVENEELIKSMQKLQAVQGVVNSIQAVTNALNKDAILGIQLRVALEKAKNFVMTGSIASTTALATAEGGLTVATNASTLAMKAFRIALIATGIGAIVVALGLLIANFDKVTTSVRKAYDWFDKLGKGIKIVIAILFPFIGLIYGAIKALEYFNIIEDKQERQRAENHRQHMKRIDAQIKKQEEQRKKREIAYNNEQKQYDREIAILDSLGKSTLEVAKKKIQSSIDYQKEKVRELQVELKAIEFLSKSSSFYADFFGKERMEILKKSLNEAQDLLKDSETQLQVLINQSNQKQIADAKKKNEALLKAQKEYNERQAKLNEEASKRAQSTLDKLSKKQFDKFQEQLKLEEEKEKRRLELLNFYNQLILSGFDLETYEFGKKQEEQLEQLDIALAKKFITQEQYNQGILAMQKNQSEFEIDIEKRKQEALKAEREKAFAEQVKGIERVIEITQQSMSAYSALNNLMNVSDNERLKKVRGNEAEELKIKKRIFERDKKLRIAQTAIDTASNIITSIKNNGGIPFGLPFGAIAGTIGALQIAAINKQTFDGSGLSSFNAPPAPTAPPPQTNTTQTNLQGGQLEQASVTKVVVLESDITKIQQKVKVAESLSGF